MVLQKSGTISMSEIRSEYNLTGSISFSTLRTTDKRVPQASAVTMSGMYNKYYIPQSGVRVWLDAKDSYSGSGTTWNDIMGNANSTLVGTPSYTATPGYFGFNTSAGGQCVSVPSVSGVSDFNVTDAYSVVFWYWANGTQVDVNTDVVEKWSGGTSYPYVVRLNKDAYTMVCAMYNISTAQNPVVTANTLHARDRWYNFAAVFEPASSRITLYQNGTNVGTNTTATVSSSISNNSPLYLMCRAGTGNWTSGRFSILNIFNRALTSTEITNIYQATRDRFTRYNIVTANLALYYDPSDADTYAGSGTTLTDLSGNGRHGTLQGGASVINKQIVLNGSPQYVSTTYQPNLDNNRAYTWELWFRDDSPGTVGNLGNTALISNYGPNATTPYALLHVADNGTLYTTEQNTVSAYNAAVASTPNICNGVWNHIVKTADATTQRIYVNGAEVGSSGRPGGVITSAMSIVIGGNHLNRYQTCKIGPVRMYYDKALSAQEVLQNYSMEYNRLSLQV